MNVISELGNELAVAVLVEKKHNEKINTQEALNLIRNVQAVLSSSAVGVNREIIEDGVNGFLATTAEEWRCKLTRLIDDAELRRRFAAAGRDTITTRYSLAVNAPAVAAILRNAAGGTRT